MRIFCCEEELKYRIRRVHCFNRRYRNNCNNIVKDKRNSFFPTLNLLNGLNNRIVLDFDGVTTDKRFNGLYELCCERENVEICSANPNIVFEWFDKKRLTKPVKINSMKGKIKKINRLIHISKKYDYTFYIDDEIEYLKFAWLFGIQTYHWDGRKIKYFSLNRGY